MDNTALYCDDNFDNLLVMIANQRRISNFDDFKQDVFLDIVENQCTTMQEYKASARKIGHRYQRESEHDDIMYSAYDDTETEDNIMSRLIYHGKASKAG